MWNHNIPLSPADLAKPLIILANSKPSGGPGTRGTPRSLEFCENGGIPRNSCHFSEFHHKSTRNSVFGENPPRNALFGAPDPSKGIGKA